MSEIHGLGYIGVEVADVAAFEAFATGVLGIEAADRSDGAVHFRWDDYASRLTVHAGTLDDIAYAGWEVAGAAALRSLTERLRAAGAEVAVEGPDAAAKRNVR
jgi:catechol 2,3-dioxygenase-like lactoylglutathione lyase family enzyme